ncbi:MAG: ribonucleoside triphosphate reductase [[Eubacterium] sulci]|nr:ribonucleoside triphosphate reductase [[Eubacterium] sulci]MBF1147439.1 ribonucleoside triphosphate reductase [[Eubacterium] sulci]MBF1153537.1 ribonucleoside triphosphate reductase [[Eubacterium] sulci]MBF1154432.1 ribonucleoside triphosphate reductase [[Eubacterium] sulci]
MNNVIRRDGTAVAFDPTKIENAVAKAFMATDELDARDISSVSRAICLIVTTTLNGRKLDAATVEEIQDEVESALMNCGYAKTAKAYILYRRQHANVRETKDTLLDYKKLIDGYIGTEKDWRVKENSTVTLSVGGLILSNSGAVTANYWLSEVYDEDVADAHRNCFMHIHDLSMLTGYCAGWSLKQLIQEGLGGVPDRITSAPAKHLTTLCNQMVNFLGIMQNEWAGAQAFSSFDTYLAPFVKVDNLSYKDVKQSIQSFIYGVNTPSRWGTQAPFTNVTLDWTVPEDMINMPALVGGKEMDFTYGDCKAEMDMVNKAFIEIMIEGDANGRGFQYPIPTYSITKDFDWSETENNKLLFEMTAKYGTPYFSNYINSDMNPSDVRSMCCRLRLDLRELRKKGGGFFGSGESTGSIGVVTLNLPRIAYLSSTKEEFYSMLDKYMDIAARSLDTKRKVINRLLEEGLYPYTKRYLGAFNNHFSTIGLVGMNETILNAKWIDSDITKPEGRDFSIEVLNHMRDRLSDYQEMYGDLFNLEATPAESTTYRFAKHDTEEFADIITAACKDQAPYYTNSTHLPVNYTEDIFDALEMEDEMQTLYTSGTVFHGFLGERMPDWKAAANLVKKIAYNFKLPYYTLSPTYSICESHGYIAGEHFSCPHCGKATEVYSRITGYYRPVRNWNDGKSSEFENRKTYEPEELFSVNRNLLEEAGVDEPRVGTQTLGRANRVEAPKSNSDAEKLILVTTKTCPNCQAAKNYLNQAGIEYDVILADEADGAEIAVQYNISAAPTLIVQSGEEAELYSNVSNIRAYIGKRS